MKKNILIVQSLALLPLITPSFSLGMEISTQKTNVKSELKQLMSDEDIEKLQPTVKKQHMPVLAQLIEKFETKSDNQSKHDEINNKSSNLQLSEIEIINIPLPECMSTTKKVETITEEVANPLLQSVMLPTQEKPLTFFEQMSYRMSSSQTILKNVIQQLKDSTFDVEDARQFKLLNEAVQTATTNNDFASLATIATLCHENYQNTIRISDDVIAQGASQFLHTHYTKELSQANAALHTTGQERRQQWNLSTLACVKTISDAINSYNHQVKTITDNYNRSVTQEDERIKTLRKEISTFSSLNKETRRDTAELLINNKVKIPTNILATTMDQSTNELNSIVTSLNRIPKILEFESKASRSLAIDNK